jgi:integrase
MTKGIASVIHYRGKPIRKVYHGWEAARIVAGATRVDRPHILRHSAATIFVAAGLDLSEVSSYLGMSIQTLTKTYWHRSSRFQANIAATPPKIPPMKRLKRREQGLNAGTCKCP